MVNKINIDSMDIDRLLEVFEYVITNKSSMDYGDSLEVKVAVQKRIKLLVENNS